MASDKSYGDFLTKVNKNPSTDLSSAESHGGKGNPELKTTDRGAEIPDTLVAVTTDAFYGSDSDEPFVPVSLAWENGDGLPDADELLGLVEHRNPENTKVEVTDPADWDRRGQYKDMINAVREAGKGNDVRVYRIVEDSSRVEYFVVTRQGNGKTARLVGIKASAIES